MSLSENHIAGEQTQYEKFKDRNDQIVLDRKSGMTYKAIGEKHNIHRSTVRVILFHRNMCKWDGLYKWEHKNRNDQIVLDSKSGMSYTAIGEKHNISPEIVSSVLFHREMSKS